MVKLITLDDHQCLKVSNDIASIGQPLFSYTPIEFFNFVRVFKNGSRLSLCSRADFMDFYFSNQLYNSSVFVFNQECLNNRYFFHHTHIANSVIQVAAEKFNICYGLALIRQYDKYFDFYHFATSKSKTNIYNYYMNNIDLLERFSLYFDEKAQKIIQTVKPYVPEQKVLIESSISTNLSNSETKFLKATQFKKIYLDKKKNLFLTYREIECIYYFMHGFSAKEIGKKLKLSFRTIEYYVLTIKKRFQINSYIDLINKLKSYQILIDRVIRNYQEE